MHTTEWDVPLLAPKGLGEFNPEEYREYVRALKVKEPERKPYHVRMNRKGNPVIRINRKPVRFLTPGEVEQIAVELNLPSQRMWVEVKKRKITVIDFKTVKKMKEIPW